MDVFEQEPPTDPLTLKIIQHKGVIATPHLGNYIHITFFNLSCNLKEILNNSVTSQLFNFNTNIKDVIRVVLISEL